MKRIVLLSQLFAGVAATCLNNATFKIVSYVDSGNPLKNCKQIRMKQERRESLCPIQSVMDACPHTCGICCEDDDTYRFKLKNIDNIVGCDWITKNRKTKEKRILKYCTKNNTEGKLHTWGGRSIRDACPKSCNFCFTSDAPSMLPSSDPSGQPTNTPTLSIEPSLTPTRYLEKPSAVPTLIEEKCVDNETFTFSLDWNNAIIRKCTWLRQHRSSFVDKWRTDRYCVKPDIKASCCTSCNLPTVEETAYLRLTLVGEECVKCTNELKGAFKQEFLNGLSFEVLETDVKVFCTYDCADENSVNRLYLIVTVIQRCDADCQRSEKDFENFFLKDQELLQVMEIASDDFLSFMFPNRTDIEVDVSEILEHPSAQPSMRPIQSGIPSSAPTFIPTKMRPPPVAVPTSSPSPFPSMRPSDMPSLLPSSIPSVSSVPSDEPSLLPSSMPSITPSSMPSISPSQVPSDIPSDEPSLLPSNMPSITPSDMPSISPSQVPSDIPSDEPSLLPSSMPSITPSDMPSISPSQVPSDIPSDEPSLLPSSMPSITPSNKPSISPSQVPSDIPSDEPSLIPSSMPSITPSNKPSISPSQVPSDIPSDKPSNNPSAIPSIQPSISANPSDSPSDSPTDMPTPEFRLYPFGESSQCPEGKTVPLERCLEAAHRVYDSGVYTLSPFLSTYYYDGKPCGCSVSPIDRTNPLYYDVPDYVDYNSTPICADSHDSFLVCKY